MLVALLLIRVLLLMLHVLGLAGSVTLLETGGKKGLSIVCFLLTILNQKVKMIFSFFFHYSYINQPIN